MIDIVILGVLVVIQGGAILEVLAAVLICHEVEAAVGAGVQVGAVAMVAGAEGSLYCIV